MTRPGLAGVHVMCAIQLQRLVKQFCNNKIRDDKSGSVCAVGGVGGSGRGQPEVMGKQTGRVYSTEVLLFGLGTSSGGRPRARCCQVSSHTHTHASTHTRTHPERHTPFVQSLYKQ